MIDMKNPALTEYLFSGTFGLERETLRVTKDGYMAATPHPLKNDPYIVKDFCENQTEINTGVHASARGVIEELKAQSERLYRLLEERGEVLWMFSNPPYLRGEDDIRVAVFDTKLKGKQKYRMYLAKKYGKYKMTLSGIHVNYSFSDELLRAAFSASGGSDFTAFKNEVYLRLAEALTAGGWMINLLLSASPLLDGSFFDAEKRGEDRFTGDASVRGSFDGYWNSFSPVFDFRDIRSYAHSIEKYILDGTLYGTSELYYPIRLKPAGGNRLDILVENGVNHLEIRNVDLNPYADEGIDERDLKFIELLILYLAAGDSQPLSEQQQKTAIVNFKRAARYDIDAETLRLINGQVISVRDAGLKFLEDMKRFFDDAALFGEHRRNALAVLDFQERKLTEAGARYAERVRNDFSGGFVKKGLEYLQKRRRAGDER